MLIDQRTLAAGETALFDLRKIRDEQRPDSLGHRLPIDASIGQLKRAIRSSTEHRIGIAVPSLMAVRNCVR